MWSISGTRWYEYDYYDIRISEEDITQAAASVGQAEQTKGKIYAQRWAWIYEVPITDVRRTLEQDATKSMINYKRDKNYASSWRLMATWAKIQKVMDEGSQKVLNFHKLDAIASGV